MSDRDVERARPVVDHAAAGAVFAPAYQQWMAERLASTPPRDRDGFISPSQVLGCATAAIHQLNGERRETRHAPDLDDLFTIANQIHDMYQQRGQEMGILTDCERFVEIPELRVKGQVDGIIEKPDGDGGTTRALLEIKTVPEWLWERIARDGVPLPGNLPQTMLYLRATGLTQTHFLYVERSYFRKLEIVQDLDHDVLGKAEAWIGQVLAHQRAGTVPEPESVWRPSGRCTSCVYFRTCRDRTYRGVPDPSPPPPDVPVP